MYIASRRSFDKGYMFGFFHKKNKPRVVEEHPFYGQYIEMKDSKVKVVQHTDDIQYLDWSSLKWISIYNLDKSISGHPNCWLNFGSLSTANISICTVAGNFDQLEALLLDFADFDRETYFRIKDASEEYEETVLFRGEQQDNFTLQPGLGNSRQSLDAGVYLENYQFMLPWVNYDQLEAPQLRMEEVVYPNPIYQGTRYRIPIVSIFNGLPLHILKYLWERASSGSISMQGS